MSQTNTSSNETHMSFAAPARPSVAFSSSAHSGHGQSTPRGTPLRSSSARSARRPGRLATADKSNVGLPANITWSKGASPSAGTAKRKPSNSATLGEIEFRKQLLHVSNEMDKSEKARYELEERVSLFKDALRHRHEAMCEMNIYSNYTFDMYQRYVPTEIEYMRESLASAARIMGEQSEALAEAHLMDEGSTMRIMELGRRNEFAEDGARHIIQESEMAWQRCKADGLDDVKNALNKLRDILTKKKLEAEESQEKDGAEEDQLQEREKSKHPSGKQGESMYSTPLT